MRWNLKLFELVFVAEQRPGSKIDHVDAQSRNVRAVMLKDSLDKDTSNANKKRTTSVINRILEPFQKSNLGTMTMSYIDIPPRQTAGWYTENLNSH
jgi:hypothetical protein